MSKLNARIKEVMELMEAVDKAQMVLDDEHAINTLEFKDEIAKAKSVKDIQRLHYDFSWKIEALTKNTKKLDEQYWKLDAELRILKAVMEVSQ